MVWFDPADGSMVDPHPNAELHELIAYLQEGNADMLRKEQIIAHALVELERLTQAKLAVIERAKSQIAGITPSGRDA